MPWSCCGATLLDDVLACPKCAKRKERWTIKLKNTRRLVLPRKGPPGTFEEDEPLAVEPPTFEEDDPDEEEPPSFDEDEDESEEEAAEADETEDELPTFDEDEGDEEEPASFDEDHGEDDLEDEVVVEEDEDEVVDPPPILAPATGQGNKEEGGPPPPQVAALCIDMDANRDGQLDNDVNHADWTWGSDGHGPVVLVRTLDVANDADVAERTRLRLRWDHAPGLDWTAALTVTPGNALRIFRGRAQGAQVFVGPGGDANPVTVQLHQAQGAQTMVDGGLDLWIEAIDYPQAADGAWEVTLEVQSRSTDGAQQQTRRVVVRIAPWIMAPDFDAVSRVYIMEFVPRLQGGIRNGGTAPSNHTLRQALAGHLPGGVTLTPLQHGNSDGSHRYLRDRMRFGAHAAPGDVAFPVMLRGGQRPLGDVRLDRRNQGIGFVTGRPNAGGANQDTGGNLMVSPPVTDQEGAVTHPWGRIVYGHTGVASMAQGWRDFFAAQRVQSPVVIDTSWLSVGHADEIVSFVPAGQGYKMLLASPRKAYELLGGIDLTVVAGHRQAQGNVPLAQDAKLVEWNVLSQTGGNPASADFSANLAGALGGLGGRLAQLEQGNGRLLWNRFTHDGTSLQRWIDRFLLDDPLLQQGDQNGMDFAAGNQAARQRVAARLDALWGVNGPGRADVDVSYANDEGPLSQALGLEALPNCHTAHNLRVQRQLNHVRAILRAALNIAADDVIDVPVLFDGSGHAITGDMVNLLLVGTTCIVPKPFGPRMAGADLFEAALRAPLETAGLTVHFLDEWHEYHLDEGEIHCGTNQCPTTAACRKSWWLTAPP